jgi:hypothetical protein
MEEDGDYQIFTSTYLPTSSSSMTTTISPAPPENAETSGINPWVIVGAVVAGILLLAAICAVIVYRRQRVIR